MKNFKKLIAISLSTIVFSGNTFASNLVANDTVINKAEVENHITTGLNEAIADINSPEIEHIAKVELDRMTFMQNVEKFLVLAKYNEETTSATVNIVAE
jgi:hypothetical protein